MTLFFVYMVIVVLGFWKVATLILELDRQAQRAELPGDVISLGKVEIQKEGIMPKAKRKANLNDFARLVTKMEQGIVQVNIAQTKEILKCVNKLTGGVLYKTVRGIELDALKQIERDFNARAK